MLRNQIVKYDVIMTLLTHIIYRYLANVTPLIGQHPNCLNFHFMAFLTQSADNVDRDYIVLLSNLIVEGTVQCIVEKLDLVTGNTAGQDGDTLVMR